MPFKFRFQVRLPIMSKSDGVLCIQPLHAYGAICTSTALYWHIHVIHTPNSHPGTTTMNSTLPVTGGCMPPYIFSFRVGSGELSSNRTEIDLLLKWKAANRNVNACIVTGWSVRYASWPSYLGLPESDFTAPPHAVWSHPFELPAIANSTSVARLNSTNYHIFQLSADFETQPIKKLVVNSHIYYFQAQGKLLCRCLGIFLLFEVNSSAH